MATKRTYQVGYGRPPKDTQFRKGESGNPNGRPKGTLNVATVLARTLREKVVINEGGRRKEITKLEAATKQLVNKSASGDLRALSMLMTLARAADEAVPETANASTSNADRKVIDNMLARLHRGMKNANDTDSTK